MISAARFIAALTAASLAVWAGSASAQAYPTKPIRIIVPYAPGGSTDVLLRIFAPRLSDILGQQVLIDNPNQAFAKVTSMPDVKEKVAALGSDLVSGTPEQYEAFLKRELATWSKVVKAVGMKID